MDQNNIDVDLERAGALTLVNKLVEQNLVNNNTILVNCFPEYSSSLTQYVNHRLASLIHTDLFEQIPLEMPFPTMSQIWNHEEKEYQTFDRYLALWMKKHIRLHMNYIFLFHKISGDKDQQKLFTNIKSAIDREFYTTASPFVEPSSIKPDVFAQEFQEPITFHWEKTKK